MTKYAAGRLPVRDLSWRGSLQAVHDVALVTGAGFYAFF